MNSTRYDNMQYRRCGRSGLKLPAISLGGWHNFSNRDQAAQLMTTAFDLGITHFDLANNYGPPPGSAETSVGDVLGREFRRHRDELIISSKAGYFMWPGPYGEWGSRKNLIASCDQSLKRLKLDYVDIFYAHRPDPDTPLDETMGALETLVRQGKALYVGVSNYDAAMTRHADELLRGGKLPGGLTIHQPAYNMFHRQIESDLLSATDELGVGVIAFCPLAQGLLTDRYLQGIPDDSRAASENSFLKREGVTNDAIDKVRKLQPTAAERNQTLAQLAISWILRDPRITSVLIGASKPEQIVQNVAAVAAEPISEQHLTQIEQILT